MKRRKKTKIVEVTQLIDPDPSRVSLVSRGANNTPFRTFKALDITEKLFKENQPMTEQEKATKSDCKGLHAVIQKIQFPKDKFSDIESVESWMTSKGYEDFKILNSEDSFVVKGEEDLQDVRKIVHKDGAVTYIGKEAEVEDVEKAEKKIVANVKPRKTRPSITVKGFGAAAMEKELTRKLDYWEMMESSEVTLSGMLNAGDDGIPVGLNEITEAFHFALANALRSGNYEAIPSLTSEYGALVVKLAQLMETVTKTDEDKEIFKNLIAETFGVNQSETIPMKKDEEKNTSEDAEKDEAVKAEATQAETESANTEKEEEASAETSSEASAEEAEVEATEKSESNDDFKSLIASIAKSTEATHEVVKAIAEVKKDVEELKEKSVKSEERLTEIEEARQARKSHSSGDDTTQDEDKEETLKAEEDPLSRNAFGFLGGSPRIN